MLLSAYLSVHIVWTKGSMKDLDEHLVGGLLFHGVRSHGDVPGVWLDHLKPSWVASVLLEPSDVYTHTCLRSHRQAQIHMDVRECMC